MASERFVNHETEQAIERETRKLSVLIPVSVLSRPVRVTFPAANTTRQIAHGLGDTPDGFQVLDATGLILRTPGAAYTKDLAFLRCTSANAEATVVFFKLRETPINV